MAGSSHNFRHEESFPDLCEYMPLYKAAFEGDWEAANKFFDKDHSTMTVGISGSSKTVLHIAAISGQTLFVEKLVNKMSEKELEQSDGLGHTALYFAVVAGNLKAAKAMVKKNPRLPRIRNSENYTPILEAALLGHKELLKYLYEVTKKVDQSPFMGKDGVALLNAVIAADFYDIALDLVQCYPGLATSRDERDNSALDVLARKPSAFKNGSGLGFWQRCIYPWIHAHQSSTNKQHRRGDVENPAQNSENVKKMKSSLLSGIIQVLQWLNGRFWNATNNLVPSIKEIHSAKLKHIHAEKLVKYICGQVFVLGNYSEIKKLVNDPFLVAAEYGTVEFITICLQKFPHLMWIHDEDCRTILHIAIEHRQEKVFNFLQTKIACMNTLASFQDPRGNNILHLAAKLAPPPKLNIVSGSALQMQRELQWYKAVENVTQPTFRDLPNIEKKKQTPRVLFREAHKQLVKDGEAWMREMATSCSVVAALIATVLFAAPFTVPGGNQSSGIPVFLKDKYFLLFAISDAVGLISSLTAVLIFLAVLSSRYAQEDFLKSLPKKLIIGLSTLFLSIAAMEIAFCSIYFIMFDNTLAWTSILVASLITLPAILFVFLQFPLFAEIVCATYWTDILR